MSTARELTTLPEVWRSFFRASSPRVIVGALVAAGAVRIAIGAPRWLDAAVVGAVLAMVGPVEWIIHRFLLHARPGHWLGERLGTREAHQRHHREPDDLLWLLLRRPNAIGSCVAIIVPMGIIAWIVDLTTVSTTSVLIWGPAATAMSVGLLALLHYEWVHLLVHSRYQPTSTYYRRLDRHHRLHHFRNEQHWLGVTSTSGDRLFGTRPVDRSAVPQSATARSLGTPSSASSRAGGHQHGQTSANVLSARQRS